MAQRVRRGGLAQRGSVNTTFEVTLKGAFNQMMASPLAATRVNGRLGLRKHPVPIPGL